MWFRVWTCFKSDETYCERCPRCKSALDKVACHINDTAVTTVRNNKYMVRKSMQGCFNAQKKNRDNSCRTNKMQHNHTKRVPHKNKLHTNKVAHRKHLALLCPGPASYTVARILSQRPHLLAINIASQMHAQHVAYVTRESPMGNIVQRAIFSNETNDRKTLLSIFEVTSWC